MQCVLQWLKKMKIWRRQIRTIGGIGEAQSNPILAIAYWVRRRVRAGIVVLNEHVSWIPVKPQSPVPIFQFLEGYDVHVRIDCLISGHHVNNCHCTAIADWKLYGQFPTCYAPIRTNVIGVLQHVWAGGCCRTPRPLSIMHLRFSTSLNPASNGAPIDFFLRH